MRPGERTTSALERHFDDFARALAEEGHSRRAALRLGAAFVAALAGALSPRRAFAADPPKVSNMTCAEFCAAAFPAGDARGRCIDDAAHGTGACFECGPKGTGEGLCGDRCCPTGESCCDGICCPKGETCCDGFCCPAGHTCCFGVCCPTENAFCEPFFQRCQCFNGQFACGAPVGVCCFGLTCCNGVCCPEGFGCCGGVCCNRFCCPAYQPVSETGVCCSPGETCCGPECANLLTDERHCGNCNSPCPDGQTCCNGACFDLGTDTRHCGACGVACRAGEACVEGRCTCPAGTEACAPDVFGRVCCEPGLVCCRHPSRPEGECLPASVCSSILQ